MTDSWTVRDRSLSLPVVLGAAENSVPVSSAFPLNAQAALGGLVVAVVCDGVTSADKVEVTLQSQMQGLGWVDVKSVAVATDGVVYIKLNSRDASDSSLFPLLSIARVVASTGSGDALTVNKVYVLGSY